MFECKYRAKVKNINGNFAVLFDNNIIETFSKYEDYAYSCANLGKK